MKTTLPLAAALVLSSAALAAPEDVSWLDLDADIAQLSTTAVEADGAEVVGFLRAYFNTDSDADTQGWAFEHIRLEAVGKVEGYKWKMSTELKSGTARLADAWVYWQLADGVMARAGNFKQPFLSTFGFLRGSHRLFPKVTGSSDMGKREAGLSLNGKLMDKKLGWWVAAMNGADGASEDHHFFARATYDFGQKSAFSKFEGAVDAPEDGFNTSVALAFADDQDDALGGRKMAVELMAEGKGLFLHGELVEYHEDFVGNDKILGTPLMDTTPLALTGSYMVGDDMELALRYEDFGDSTDSSRTSLGFNYYQVLPHKVKWQVAYSDLASDSSSLEAELLTFGVTIDV